MQLVDVLFAYVLLTVYVGCYALNIGAAFCTQRSVQQSIYYCIYEACIENARYEVVDCCGHNLNLLKDILFYQISGCNLCKIKGRKGIFFRPGTYKVYDCVIHSLQISVTLKYRACVAQLQDLPHNADSNYYWSLQKTRYDLQYFKLFSFYL